MSVVVPFYDRERCLRRAIDSVTRQTYGDWELILVDDGSRDRSSEIAAACAREFPERVRVVTQSNQGPSAARNAGIAAATGSFVSFLDSDDAWEPTFLATMMAAHRACPEVDWIYADVRRKDDEEGTVLVESVFDEPSGEDLRALSTRRCGDVHIVDDPRFLETAIGSTIKEGANSVIRRHVLDVVSFHPGIRIVEDRVFQICGIAAGFTFGYVREVLLTKYHHGENISVIEAGDVARLTVLYENFIEAYEHLDETLDLSRRERTILRRRLSASYLNYARLITASKGWHRGSLAYVWKSFRAAPRSTPIYASLRKRLGRIMRSWRAGETEADRGNASAARVEQEGPEPEDARRHLA